MGDMCNLIIPLEIEGKSSRETSFQTSTESVDQVHSEIENILVEPPKVGMEFESMEEVKAYYSKYAEQVGFGVMTRTSKRRDGEVYYFVLACSREGTHRIKERKSMRNVPSRKQNCEAKISVALCDGGSYRIGFVVLDHNHDVNPSRVRMFSNNVMHMRLKRTLELNDEASIKMKKSFQTLMVGAGSHENVALGGRVELDCRHYIQKERRLIGKGGDAEALCQYFVRMQEQNSNFFYVLDMDESFRVNNVFWADARSRAAYESFGDVITFDTTYLTNHYEMPFVAFVGVNHHGQSILLGCGLLSSQDTDSFVWLFQVWLNCMKNVPPKGIITDRCKAIQNAIEIVFPFTRHRWCLWHIKKNFPQMLSGYSECMVIVHHLKNVVYDSLTTDEFEMNWKKVVEQYSLKDNEWLEGLFLERQRWVPTYVKGDFWAGMSTTQCSESMNAFFDGYVNHQTSLKHFVEKYDKALQDKAEKEFEADFRSFSSILACATKSPFERQFQSSYTHSKYLEVQAEFVGKADCLSQVGHDDGSICHYNVFEDMILGDKAKKAKFEVTFDRKNCDVNCTCHLFQFRGIVCRHSLVILSQEQVMEVPDKYLLDRWKKNTKRRHTFIKTSYDVKQFKPRIQRFDVLREQFDGVAEVASEFEETSSFVKSNLGELMDKIGAMTICLRNST